MTRDQYLQTLWSLLAPIPEVQRRELMLDYEEHFRMTLEHGGTEADAARELGDPQLIAKELLLGYRVNVAEERGDVVSVSKAVMATVGLGFFNLIFILGPYIALLGVLIALWAVTFALAVTPLLLLYEAFFGSDFTVAQSSFISLALIGFAILFGVGTYRLTQAVFKMTLKYLKFNTRVMKGRKT